MKRRRVSTVRRRSVGRTYSEQLQEIARAYIDADQPWPASTREIAAWAIRRRLWYPQPWSLIEQCAEQIARAMREEYITDAQGRRIRAKHAARVDRGGEQITLWADIRTADRRHMAIAFQQRRLQVLGECRQLEADVDSYNENQTAADPIQIVFDFAVDLAEEEAARSRAV